MSRARDNAVGKMPGNVIQVQEFKGTAGDKTVTTGTTTLASGTMTLSANSKLFMTYITSQMVFGSTSTNPEIFIQIDGVNQGGLDTDHMWYSTPIGQRAQLSLSIMSSSVITAGTHTVSVIGGAYNGGSVTYDYQSSGNGTRVGRLIVMEIAQ